MSALRTFQNADPAIDDVVLCRYCGESLQDEESDVFWKDNQNHECIKMVKADLAELMRPVSFAETDAAIEAHPTVDTNQPSFNRLPLQLALLVKHILQQRQSALALKGAKS